jgi:ATP-dependent exoDNAse (exonuclease V) alpha subunit
MSERTSAPYRLSAKVFSRSQGHNVISAAAYRACEKLVDHREDGRTFDYSRRTSQEQPGMILAPEHAPAWVFDRETLWNAVEAKEDTSQRRKSAQLAREVQLMLPRELGPDERRALVQHFVRDQFVRLGMIADIAFHSDPDDHNPHAHILLTMRTIGPDGFGKKAREWNDAGFYRRDTGDAHGELATTKDDALIRVWRKEWERAVNGALAESGARARFDARRLEEMGTPRQPEPHLGIVRWMMVRGVAAISDRLEARLARWKDWKIREGLRGLIQSTLGREAEAAGGLFHRFFSSPEPELARELERGVALRQERDR